MKLEETVWLLLLCGASLIANSQTRRIQVNPEQEDESIQYYAAAEPREDAQRGGVVYVTAEQYNGLYGQPTASPRIAQQDNYIQPSRAPVKPARVKDSPKAPPVQTIRNYNKVNDDGSFTFGYEAADGSFKEETRGTDCVVRGKYGYVDPDGNKREFTYVSGNPCDPNAPKEEELPEEESNEPENLPANYPTKPIAPLRAKPTVTFFQNDYQRDEEVQPEPEQILRQHPVQSLHVPVRPQYITRTRYPEPVPETASPSFQRTRLLSATTPASIVYKQSVTPLNITPRPVTTIARQTELPPTTYRPQLLQIAVTPRPSLVYTKQLSVTPRPAILPSTISPVPLSVTGGSLDFESEFQRFQHDNSVVSPSPSPRPVAKATFKQPKTPSSTPAPSPSGQVYSSELVFDPVSGLYNTQLYQSLPQTDGEFTLNHRIQPYVHQPQHPLLNFQQLQQQSPLYRNPKPQPPQALYQQQQADLQFQNSAQLYAQQQHQQKLRAQGIKPPQPQPIQPQIRPQPQQQQQQQQYYYIQPSSFQQPHGLVGGGGIDDFLRGHGIPF